MSGVPAGSQAIINSRSSLNRLAPCPYWGTGMVGRYGLGWGWGGGGRVHPWRRQRAVADEVRRANHGLELQAQIRQLRRELLDLGNQIEVSGWTCMCHVSLDDSDTVSHSMPTPYQCLIVGVGKEKCTLSGVVHGETCKMAAPATGTTVY